MTWRDAPLTRDTLEKALKEQDVHGCHLDVFDSLPSTSEYLSALSQTGERQQALQQSQATSVLAPHLCATDWQTNGNGRRGKTWVTDRGNITFSILLGLPKPASELLGLSLVTGICVAEALKSTAQLDARLKWPNDVLVNNKKVCGLLTELVPGSAGVTEVIVGIGVNYVKPVRVAGAAFEPGAIPLESPNCPARAHLMADITARLLTAYQLFLAQGWPAFALRWEKLDFLHGKTVLVQDSGADIAARASGVNADGALLVSVEGELRPVYSGDVSVRLG